MLAYLVRRLLGAIPLLLGILTLIFFVLQLAPGDPIQKFASPNVSPEVLEQMRRNFGLDRPLHEQYGKWLWSFVTGDFGYSFGQMRPINEILPGILWNTMQLTLISLVVIFVVGMLIGIVQAVRQYSIADNVLTFLALFFYSMPSFWFALMLILIFSLRAGQEGWPLSFPASGMTSIDYEYLTGGEKIRDRVMHLILPAIALGIGSAAGVARYMRGAMLEVIHQDFIRTARAKGLSERTVVFKHALRNALIPIITLLGLYLPFLLSGAVLVETIFAWPGMGRAIVDAILARDYPMVMATSFVIASMVVLGNLLSDVLYAVVDPRIRND
ncbi:MAG: Oligopeptide transport system permease protein OppB [uncultured Gemmatimonadetes bacterium]|uniref:Oligopeptide transport system permease protein OppB n=1 Tax=uncultured Gemmatimonadota bacterium TaxID=203437 RepID=A0A6J4L1K1_9BACT|nr:MAG: Oligopeptide transport system permease protein OppB [uncultured Gemmatimonadota bacterium]